MSQTIIESETEIRNEESLKERAGELEEGD